MAGAIRRAPNADRYFEYRDLQVSTAQIKPDRQAMVRVRVINSGRRSGDEVVQLYIRDVLREGVTRPVKELKAFRRISKPRRGDPPGRPS